MFFHKIDGEFMGENNQEIIENDEQKATSLQNKVRTLILSALLVSGLSMILGIYSIIIGGIFNPSAYWSLGGLLPGMILVIFLLWKYWKIGGYSDELTNIFSNYSSLKGNLKKTFEDQKKQEVEKIEKIRRNLQAEIENNALLLERNRFYHKIITFFREYKINLDENEVYNYILNELKGELTSSNLFKLLEAKRISNKEILDLLYQCYTRSIIDDLLWTRVKENALSALFDIVKRSGRLVPFSDNLPNDIQLYLLENMKTFSIEGFNHQITYLYRFSSEILDFYIFAKEENIKTKEYSLWMDILNWQKKFIENPPNFEQQFWDLCINTIFLDLDWQFKDNLSNVLVFYFFRNKYPHLNSLTCKIISQSIETSKILFLFLQNKKNSKLFDYFSENIIQIQNYIRNTTVDPLFEAFQSELSKGRYIFEENHLFKIYRDERSFDLSYLTPLILNPDMPIDFEYAQDHYYSLEASIPVLLRTMNLGKKRPFLLTFASEGGIAEAINELMDFDNFTEFKNKYDIQQYSKSARLGILNDMLDSIERYEIEMKKDLPKTFPFMKSTIKKVKESFNNFIDSCVSIEELKELIKDLSIQFESYINLVISRQGFIHKLEIFRDVVRKNKNLEDKEILEFHWQNLLKSLRSYPPTFQVLLHELEYDEKKIRVFGEYAKIDPFTTLKEMCARDIKDKELLLASVDFGAKRKITHSVKDINEGLINSFTLYALISREIMEIRNNSTFKDFFDEKIIQFIIASCYQNCTIFLDFCLKLSEELLPSIKDLLLNQLKAMFPDILRRNAAKLQQICDLIVAYGNLEENKDVRINLSPDLVSKIASAFINSCLCIATVIYPKINEAIKSINQEEVKKIKQQFLEKLDLGAIQEKKVILIFYCLLSLYKDNLLRPLFRPDDIVNEQAFHDKVFTFLRTPFGDDIQDESDVAHGILDIYAFGTPVELKVEDTIQEISAIYDRHKTQFNAYCYRKQTTLGILYVYDNTVKVNEDYPRNDLQLFQSGGYDCAVIVLRGNLPRASALAPKKIAKKNVKKSVKRNSSVSVQ